MDNYYVYVLIETSSKNIIYVGKGKGRRIHYHLRFIKNHDKPNKRINNYLFYKAKSILNSGGEILESKVFINLTEENALKKETKLIAEIGLDNLCNFSPSGSLNIPPKGTKKYEDYIEKLSQASKDRWADPDYKSKMMIIRKHQGENQSGENHPMYGKTHTDETKVKLSIAASGRKQTTESIEKTRSKLLGREITWKDKISKGNTLAWEEKLRNGYSISDETKAKISKNSVGKYDKILDAVVSDRIVELYELYGACKIRKQLLIEGYDVSLYIIRRELKESGKYKKFRKSAKL